MASQALLECPPWSFCQNKSNTPMNTSLSARAQRSSTAMLGFITIAVAMLMSLHANAVVYAWNVTSGNWSTPGSWIPNTSIAGPTSADTAIFGTVGTSASSATVNNVVDVTFTVATLSY